jgi:DNA-binding NarL/FixJ family response regulator
MHDESVYAERVLRAGARGYIMKEAGGANLLAAIRQVLRGEVYVSPALSVRILENLAAHKPRGSHSPVEKLSDREFEVYRLIGEGKATVEVARQLRLSPKTVDVHRANIKRKLGFKDATALVHNAILWAESRNA